MKIIALIVATYLWIVPVAHGQTTATPTTSPVVSAPPSQSLVDSIYNNLQLFRRYSGFGSNDIRIVIAEVVRSALGFVGIIFVALILLAGLRFMTSGGDDEVVVEAKKSLLNAIVGLLIMLLSYSIVTYVIGTFSTSTAPTREPTSL